MDKHSQWTRLGSSAPVKSAIIAPGTDARSSRKGFTLVEILIAAALISITAAGSLASFIAAARISKDHNTSTMAQAGGYTQQVLEQFRDAIEVNPDPLTNKFLVDIGKWNAVALENLSTSGLAVTDSMMGVEMEYKVTAIPNCGGNVGETCYQVTVRECWDDSTKC